MGGCRESVATLLMPPAAACSGVRSASRSSVPLQPLAMLAPAKSHGANWCAKFFGKSVPAGHASSSRGSCCRFLTQHVVQCAPVSVCEVANTRMLGQCVVGLLWSPVKRNLRACGSAGGCWSLGPEPAEEGRLLGASTLPLGSHMHRLLPAWQRTG
jgi:hypothetical protein